MSAAAVGCLLAAPAVSSADVTYKLDGSAVTAAEAQDGSLGGGCAASPSPEGVVECFSTEAGRDQAVAEDIEANDLPPGFGVMPSAAQKRKLLRAASRSTKLRARPGGRRLAHAAGCGNATHVHVDYFQQGTYGYFYATEGWQNFVSPFNNTISSDTTSALYHSYYHAGLGGSGHYYDLARNYCHVDNSLAYDSYPDGGTWDNRFSSYSNS